jgi:predicted flap endonuclease-1-like 5' DNA nuclease
MNKPVTRKDKSIYGRIVWAAMLSQRGKCMGKIDRTRTFQKRIQRSIRFWNYLQLVVIVGILIYLWLKHQDEQINHPNLERKPKLEKNPEKGPVEKKIAKLDDLTRISGIGKKVSQLLNEAGISTISQLAHADLNELARILDENKLQFMDPADWKSQALVMIP